MGHVIIRLRVPAVRTAYDTRWFYVPRLPRVSRRQGHGKVLKGTVARPPMALHLSLPHYVGNCWPSIRTPRQSPSLPILLRHRQTPPTTFLTFPSGQTTRTMYLFPRTIS